MYAKIPCQKFTETVIWFDGILLNRTQQSHRIDTDVSTATNEILANGWNNLCQDNGTTTKVRQHFAVWIYANACAHSQGKHSTCEIAKCWQIKPTTMNDRSHEKSTSNCYCEEKFFSTLIVVCGVSNRQ